MRLAALFAIAALASAAGERAPAVSRADVEAVERSVYAHLDKADPADRFEILAFPQGVYLPGYGVVFTAKVSLIYTPAPTPFRQTMSAQDIARIRDRKLKKLPLLKATLRQALVGAAKSLDTAPSGQQVVLAVALYYLSWEDRSGMPNQIVVHGDRAALLRKAAEADAAIQMEEY